MLDPVTVDQLAELLADFDHHDERADQAYRDGYADGFRSGEDVGYARAHEEMAARWRALAATVRGHADSPTYAELERRRAAPGGAVYEQAQARHNGSRRSA